MAIRIDVTQRVVETVLILVQGLGLSEISIESRIIRSTVDKVVQLIWSTLELIGTSEPALGR
jgi:hypothetical protein